MLGDFVALIKEVNSLIELSACSARTAPSENPFCREERKLQAMSIIGSQIFIACSNESFLASSSLNLFGIGSSRNISTQLATAAVNKKTEPLVLKNLNNLPLAYLIFLFCLPCLEIIFLFSRLQIKNMQE